MPRSASKPEQSRQDRSGVLEKSTPLVSMPAPADDSGAARRQLFIDRVHRFVGGEYREWHDYNLAKIGACLEILENDQGFTTPFEQFVYQLLLQYVFGNSESQTPEGILNNEFQQFKEDFADAIRDARNLLRRHPDLIKAEEPAAAV